MSDHPEHRPWDRRDGETAKAYAAFVTYRDLGPVTRTLDAAFRQAKGLPEDSRKRPDGRWNAWYRDHEWKKRVEAYDAHMELQARREREREHLDELEAFRGRQKRLATATLENAIALLQKSGARLKAMSAEEIPAKALPAFFRAAAAVASAATDSEAQALAVAELLNALDGDGL